MDKRPLIHGLSKSEIGQIVASLGQPSYRATQIWEWLYKRMAFEWNAMSNLPLALREHLDRELAICPGTLTARSTDASGSEKLLLTLRDGECVEQVLIPAPGRKTVCVSSQVGCRFKCAFCASGQAGFRRNLEAGEIVAQTLWAALIWERRPSNVVFMGIGEPLDNYDNVLKAIRIINDSEGLGIGARKITISTSGIIPGMERLAGEGLQIELSVSLHAPTQELRSRLMPVARLYPLDRLIRACRSYFEKTKRLITFEYVLIRGTNDQASHARKLAELLSDFPCRVNLLLLSPVPEFKGTSSSPDAANAFINTLSRAGINATLRAPRGLSVNAACGQLRSSRLCHADTGT